MSPSRKRVPELLLERYLAEDLLAAARREVEEGLAQCPEDRERLEQLRRERADFARLHPLPRGPARQGASPRWRWALLGLPAAVAAGLVLWLLPTFGSAPPAVPWGAAKGQGLELRTVPCEQGAGRCVRVESSAPGWAALVDGSGHAWLPARAGGDGLRRHLLSAPPEAASGPLYVLFSNAEAPPRGGRGGGSSSAGASCLRSAGSAHGGGGSA